MLSVNNQLSRTFVNVKNYKIEQMTNPSQCWSVDVLAVPQDHDQHQETEINIEIEIETEVEVEVEIIIGEEISTLEDVLDPDPDRIQEEITVTITINTIINILPRSYKMKCCFYSIMFVLKYPSETEKTHVFTFPRLFSKPDIFIMESEEDQVKILENKIALLKAVGMNNINIICRIEMTCI